MWHRYLFQWRLETWWQGNIALRVGAKGICTSTVTACASATHSIGEAFRNIKHGYSDVIIAGGAEAPITEIGISGFASLTALTKATDPEKKPQFHLIKNVVDL